MNSLGGYPAGAQYDPRAPYNEHSEECQCCHGTGLIFHKYDPNLSQEVEVSEEEFFSLPDPDPYDDSFISKGEAVFCPACDGLGEILYDGNYRRK